MLGKGGKVVYKQVCSNDDRAKEVRVEGKRS